MTEAEAHLGPEGVSTDLQPPSSREITSPSYVAVSPEPPVPLLDDSEHIHREYSGEAAPDQEEGEQNQPVGDGTVEQVNGCDNEDESVPKDNGEAVNEDGVETLPLTPVNFGSLPTFDLFIEEQ